MSAVKDFLASQRAGFISLHELLEAMTKQGEGCSLAEAAAVLAQIIEHEWLDNPWVTHSASHGIKDYAPRCGETPEDLLRHVVRGNTFEGDPYAIPF